MASYKEWEAAYVANGGDRRLTISLGPAKGLATASSTTYGRMILDLLAGTISVEVAALPEGRWDGLADREPFRTRTKRAAGTGGSRWCVLGIWTGRKGWRHSTSALAARLLHSSIRIL